MLSDESVSIIQKHKWHQSSMPFVFASLLLISSNLIIRFITTPDTFADFNSYVNIANELSVLTSIWDIGIFEPFSYGLLFLFVNNIQDTHQAVAIAFWFNSIVFIAIYLVIVKKYEVDWRNFLLSFAIYGPLLSFVTLRATPAYLLVIIAVLVHRKNGWFAFAVCLIAAGFHISALLCLPLLMVSKILQQKSIDDSNFINRFIVFSYSLGLLIFTYIIFTQLQLDWFTPLLSEQQSLIKYQGYAQTSFDYYLLMHRIYFVFIAIMTFIFVNSKSYKSRELSIYIVLSFVMFSVLQASPVVAYRQSLYWTIPALLYMPIKSWINTEPKTYLYLLSCITVYLFGLAGVID